MLRAAQGPLAASILGKTQAIWTPYQAVLAPVLTGSATDAELQTAVDYAKANNLKLLALMNELTTALEAVASQRANTLRMVQTVGSALALLKKSGDVDVNLGSTHDLPDYEVNQIPGSRHRDLDGAQCSSAQRGSGCQAHPPKAG